LDGTFLEHGVANLLNGIPASAVSVGGPPTGALKEHLFHFILDWLIATPSVKSRPHGAELIRSRESDKRLTYAPIRLLPDETVSTAAKLSSAFDGIALADISGRKSPPLSLNKHCAECEFQPRCVPIAREADDLSLLAKVAVKDREKYRNKGIFSEHSNHGFVHVLFDVLLRQPQKHETFRGVRSCA
jgi:hypothetical protein